VSGPKALVWVLATAVLGALLWCARGILTSELPRGAGLAAWLLWLIAASALLTLLAYVRELALHHHAVRGGSSWQPLPALLVLWVGGLTALVSLPLVLPGEKAAAAAESATARVTNNTSPPMVRTTTSARPSATTVARSATSATTVATSTARTAPPTTQRPVQPPPSPVSQPASVSPARSTSADAATSSGAATTSGKPSSKPEPTRSTGVLTPPAITLTLP
jgi:hypothetical protein